MHAMSPEPGTRDETARPVPVAPHGGTRESNHEYPSGDGQPMAENDWSM